MKRISFFFLLILTTTVAFSDICIKDGDTIAFLGDSITAYGHQKPLGYVNLVMKGLEVAGVHANMIPAGRGGHESTNMAMRIEGVVLSKKPQWMVLSCGVNDILHHHAKRTHDEEFELYKRNMRVMLDKAAAANVTTILATPTMIRERIDQGPNVHVIRYGAWVVEEAARRGLRVAEMYGPMVRELKRLREEGAPKGRLLLTKDGIHMAYAGDRVMAWQLLLAMGVPEANRPAIEAAWAQMEADAKQKASEEAKKKNGKSAEAAVLPPQRD